MAENVAVLLVSAATLLDEFIQALSECYALDGERFYYNDLRRLIYSEAWLYGEHIHTEALLVVENILLITEYRLNTKDMYGQPPAHLVTASEAMQILLRTLKRKYCRVLGRIQSLRSEIEKAREKLNDNKNTAFRNRSTAPTNTPIGSKIEPFPLDGMSPPRASMSVDTAYHRSVARLGSPSPVGNERTNNQNRPNEPEPAQTESKKRFIPSNPINIGLKRNNKIGEGRRRDLWLVAQCLKALESAVQSLYQFLDPAGEYLSLLTDPNREILIRLSGSAPLVPPEHFAEKVVNQCKRLLLSRMGQHVAFYGIKEKITDHLRKQWWKDIMEDRTEI